MPSHNYTTTVAAEAALQAVTDEANAERTKQNDANADVDGYVALPMLTAHDYWVARNDEILASYEGKLALTNEAIVLAKYRAADPQKRADAEAVLETGEITVEKIL